MKTIKALFLVGMDGFLWILFFGSLLNHKVIVYAENRLFSDPTELPYNEYGLVLGTSKDGRHGLNPYFVKRLDAAVTLYENKKIKKIIVSGDNHIVTYNETQDMTDYLIARGIPETAIIKDYAGFRTLDSVVRSKLVFGCDSITIISQRIHNERALYIARHYDLEAVGFNAQDVNSTRNYTHAREFFAKCWVFVDLYIFHTAPKFL